MTLRAIIIDDEQNGINTLKRVIAEFIGDVKVVAESTKAVQAIELIENYKPEIVFLDINMPEMSGFELLEKLSWKNFNLVFVTAHQEYALRALKSNAMDYLLKPVDHNDLRLTIDRIKTNTITPETIGSLVKYTRLLNELTHPGKNKIVLNQRSGVESIYLDTIIYLESMSNYTQLYLTDGDPVLASKNLKEFEDELRAENSAFMRVHHSYIVNTHKIVRYLKSDVCIVMSNGKQIPVSKSRRNFFLSWLNLQY